MIRIHINNSRLCGARLNRPRLPHTFTSLPGFSDARADTPTRFASGSCYCTEATRVSIVGEVCRHLRLWSVSRIFCLHRRVERRWRWCSAALNQPLRLNVQTVEVLHCWCILENLRNLEAGADELENVSVVL